MTRTELQERIAAALASGEHYDKLSDLAYGQRRYMSGDHWGNLAIAAYTRAEQFAEQLADLESES